MKTLKKFDFPETKGGFKSQYDWDKILSGAIVQLEHGKDYNCKNTTFATLCRNAAKKRGMGVKTASVEGGIVVQAVAGAAVEETTETAPAE